MVYCNRGTGMCRKMGHIIHNNYYNEGTQPLVASFPLQYMYTVFYYVGAQEKKGCKLENTNAVRIE